MNDHIVSWANSSLRWNEDMPELQLEPDDPPRTGILLEDPVSAAFGWQDWQEITRWAEGGPFGTCGYGRGVQGNLGNTTRAPFVGRARLQSAGSRVQIGVVQHVTIILG